MFQRLGFAAFLFVALAGAAPVDPAALFGARESLQQVSISPDGKRIAYSAPFEGKGTIVYTVDLETGQSIQTTAVDGQEQRLGTCGWVADDRLLCYVFGLERVRSDVGASSVFVAIDVDGSDLVTVGKKDWRTHDGAGFRRVVDWLATADGSVMMSGWLQPGAGRSNPGLGVVRVDTRTNEVEVVQRPIPDATFFLSDGEGRIRIQGTRRVHGATMMASEETEYRYRARESDEWRPFAIYNSSTRDGVLPLAVDAALDSAYVLDTLDGRTALYRVALDGSGERELLLAHEKVDVDDVLRLGRRGRVVGGTYADERRRAVYFDPELRQLAEQLSKALPNLPLIRFVGASDDEQVLLIWAGSDRDPGRYYTYDKGTRRLNEIMLSRPRLEGVPLAEVRPIQFPAADGTSIPGYLTVPPDSAAGPRPAIVMPHGGPESRDEWGFDWLAQYFANRGYLVLQPNFRGSAGYGDEWFQQNGFKSWRTAIGDVNDAGRWLIAQGLADPEKLAVVGWSYGGYAALQSGVVDPDLYRAIIAIAPVTNLNLLKEESRGWSNFRLMRDYIGSGPHIREGSPVDNASAIDVPVLMFHGDHDRNVDIRHARSMERSLDDAGKEHELVVYPGLDHHLQDSAARADMLRRSDAFLRASMGM